MRLQFLKPVSGNGIYVAYKMFEIFSIRLKLK